MKNVSFVPVLKLELVVGIRPFREDFLLGVIFPLVFLPLESKLDLVWI